MKIIVTGATGFIGRNLVEQLSADNVDVIGTGRSVNVGSLLSEQGFEFRPANLTTLSDVKAAFKGVECVIHCAAKSADWGSRLEFWESNVIGTRNVIEACKRHDIKKIIFVSTPSVYFSGKDRLNITEDEPLPPKQLTHYGRTKAINEKELLGLSQLGFKVIIFRPRAVYGRYDNTIAPRVLKMAKKKQFPLINGGVALTDITYIDNFVDVVRKALFADDVAWNEVYNISNGEPIVMRNWFSGLLQALDIAFKPKDVPEKAATTVAAFMEIASLLPFGPTKPSLTRFSVGYMSKSMTMSIEKARLKLGYEPKVGNEQGFAEYARWYKANT